MSEPSRDQRDPRDPSAARLSAARLPAAELSAAELSATELSAEDVTLLTLARGARGRAGAPEGAAVRDDMGRTYAAASVGLTALRLSALQAAVAAALSSGSRGFEAAVVVGAADDPAGDQATDDPAGDQATDDAADVLAADDLALLDEVGCRDVVLARPDGTLVARLTR